MVTLKQGEREWKVNIGDDSGSGESDMVYLTSSDRPKEVMAVPRSQLQGLFRKTTVAVQEKVDDKTVPKEEERYVLKSLNDFRSRELLAQGVVNLPDTVFQVALHPPGQSAVVLKKGEDGHWRFQEPKLGIADYDGAGMMDAKTITGVRELLTDLANLKVSSTPPQKPMPGAGPEEQGTPDFVANDVQNMAQYGLTADKPATLRLEIERKTTAGVGGEPSEAVKEVLLVGNKAADKYFARLEDEKAVVKVQADKVEPFLNLVKQPDTLRSRDLVQVDATRVDALDIKNSSGQVLKLRRSGPGDWKLLTDKEPQKAETQAVQQILDALTAKRQVTGFLDHPSKEAEDSFNKPEAVVVSLWVDGLQKEETKEGQPGKKEPAGGLKLKDEKHPTVQLTFGLKTDKNVDVRREEGNDKMLLEVPVSVYDKVDQKPLAFHDRTLPPMLETGEITRLVIERAGTKYELVRDQKDTKSPGEWKFAQPKELVDRKVDAANVERIITELKALKTEKLAAEKPNDAELAQEGLKPPQIQLTVTVRKEGNKTEDHAFLFGKETKDGVYATESGFDLVFFVPPFVMESLNGELQDPTVFQFSLEKVQALKITGWKKAQGFNVTLQVERKDPLTWNVKAPDGFDLDNEKVNTFLSELSNLRAQRFVVRKTGPVPDQHLDEKERNLQIEITLAGEKAPLSLTIGDLDAKDKGYFAQSSTLAGDVFLLAQERWDNVLSGVKYFSKK
ncbi:MAG: DUF4340 domain-containing protein [Planctomycetes bacterium]|nr:DUF4340 domain-containing protein [Planctomycetota bacterium]